MGTTKEELAALSREDLEAALAYYQPRAQSAMAEGERLRQQIKALRAIAGSRSAWKRLRFVLKGGLNEAR
jgi:hypothetical protein